MIKLRADNFVYPADDKSIMKIQEIMQKYYKDEFGEPETIDQANTILNVYAQIAFDEGYRKAIEEAKDEYSKYSHIKTIKAKPRKKGWFEYVDEGDLKKSFNLCQRRIESKRQKESRKKYCEDNSMKYTEESFVLSMVIHTYFEAGYLKAQSIEEQAKIFTGDEERANLLVQMFNECFEQIMENK